MLGDCEPVIELTIPCCLRWREMQPGGQLICSLSQNAGARRGEVHLDHENLIQRLGR
jgi:hypothetical protein